MTTQEREDDAVALSKAKGGSGGGKKGKLKMEVAPSPQGIRVAPRYVLDLRNFSRASCNLPFLY